MKQWYDYISPITYAASIATPSLALEFGVASGRTLEIISKWMPAIGFDSFDGLPEKWREGFDKGMFACTPPDLPGAEIVVGLFEDTLPKWVGDNDDILQRLSLVHIDCDLYSSTVTVLDNIGRYLVPGVIVVFDEYYGYPGWEDHEYKAWDEFVNNTGIEYLELGRGPEQIVMEIK